MSYICLIANEKGVAAAADSRMTIYPSFLRMHLDRTRKVFVDEKQKLVWACCGLTVYAGVNYFRVIERILRSPHKSMAAKMNRIESTMKNATRACHLLTRQRCIFTLLLCEQKEEGNVVTVMDVLDGRIQKRQYTGAVAVEGGSRPKEPLPSGRYWKDATVSQLADAVRKRAMEAVKLSEQAAKADKKEQQTVGGNVRVVYLERK